MGKPGTCYVVYTMGTPPRPAILRALEDCDAVLPPGWSVEAAGDLRIATPAATIAIEAQSYPYPPTALTNDLAQHTAWPEWREESRAWRSHLALRAEPSEADEYGQRAAAADLMRVTAALAVRTGAATVGWSENLLFQPASDFAAAVARSPLPVEVLVRCRWYGEEWSRLGTRTGGLGAFDLPEIDHLPTGEDAARIAARVLDLSAWMLAGGLVVRDGDTLGARAEGGMRVRHIRDAAGDLVLRLEPLAA